MKMNDERKLACRWLAFMSRWIQTDDDDDDDVLWWTMKCLNLEPSKSLFWSLFRCDINIKCIHLIQIDPWKTNYHVKFYFQVFPTVQMSEGYKKMSTFCSLSFMSCVAVLSWILSASIEFSFLLLEVGRSTFRPGFKFEVVVLCKHVCARWSTKIKSTGEQECFSECDICDI